MYHNKCGEHIFLNLSGNIAIAVSFDISSSDCLVTREIYLAEKNPNKIELDKSLIDFYCNNCKKSIRVEEIETHCCFCRELLSIKNLKVYNSGVYCNKCIKLNSIDKLQLSPAINSFKNVKFV